MRSDVNEKDWKLYSKKIADWQEAFMGRLCREYIELLSNESENPSERFWALADRIKQDQRLTGVTAKRSRSTMQGNILDLLKESAITLDDLSDFSEELQERMRLLTTPLEEHS